MKKEEVDEMKTETKAQMIIEFLMSRSSEYLSSEIAKIEATVVDGKFQSETDGRKFALLKLAQMREVK